MVSGLRSWLLSLDRAIRAHSKRRMLGFCLMYRPPPPRDGVAIHVAIRDRIESSARAASSSLPSSVYGAGAGASAGASASAPSRF